MHLAPEIKCIYKEKMFIFGSWFQKYKVKGHIYPSWKSVCVGLSPSFFKAIWI
jgi:hypothetical protein